MSKYDWDLSEIYSSEEEYNKDFERFKNSMES